MYEYQPEFNRERASQRVKLLDRVRFQFYPATTVLDTWSGQIMSVPQAYAGKITSVVIRKGSYDLAVPASTVVGDSVELHAFGRNDGIAVKMGMSAVVTKPDGTTLSGKYEMLTAQNAGQTLRFSIMNIAINVGGSWTAVITYYAIY